MKQKPKTTKKLEQHAPSKTNAVKKQDDSKALVYDGEREIQLYDLFKVSFPDSVAALINQSINALPPRSDFEDNDITNRTLALIIGIQPMDTLELMLAVQAVGVHNLSMEMMSRAAVAGRTEAIDSAVNRATKLSRTFVTLIEALNKHRGRGGQKMTVEHVHVNKGGKAVIGNVEGGGGIGNKK